MGDGNGFEISGIYVKGMWWGLINLLNLYIAKWVFRRGPFWESKLFKKEDGEYSSNTGFMEVFIKYKKK